MSKIWNALREAERLKKQRVEEEGIENYWDTISDRRSTKRFLANAPVLVYGYGTAEDPFHALTEATSVNAGGGLITLATAVNAGAGQILLLINETNLKEEKCTVIRRVFSCWNSVIVLASSLSLRSQYPIIFGARLQTGNDSDLAATLRPLPSIKSTPCSKCCLPNLTL
jgi:hypothetical protein